MTAWNYEVQFYVIFTGFTRRAIYGVLLMYLEMYLMESYADCQCYSVPFKILVLPQEMVFIKDVPYNVKSANSASPQNPSSSSEF